MVVASSALLHCHSHFFHSTVIQFFFNITTHTTCTCVGILWAYVEWAYFQNIMVDNTFNYCLSFPSSLSPSFLLLPSYSFHPSLLLPSLPPSFLFSLTSSFSSPSLFPPFLPPHLFSTPLFPPFSPPSLLPPTPPAFSRLLMWRTNWV